MTCCEDLDTWCYACGSSTHVKDPAAHHDKPIKCESCGKENYLEFDVEWSDEEGEMHLWWTRGALR